MFLCDILLIRWNLCANEQVSKNNSVGRIVTLARWCLKVLHAPIFYYYYFIALLLFLLNNSFGMVMLLLSLTRFSLLKFKDNKSLVCLCFLHNKRLQLPTCSNSMFVPGIILSGIISPRLSYVVLLITHIRGTE